MGDIANNSTASYNLYTPSGYRFQYEEEWVNLQPFLQHRGYKLRPRFQPDWTPSWEGKKLGFLFKYFQEDYRSLLKAQIMDAVRSSDNRRVVLKSVRTNTAELPLLQLLNSPEMRADKRNNVVQVLDILLSPDTDDEVFVVMPRLMVFAAIPFQYVCEVFEAFEQYLEGLSFLHEHNIAHRDVCFFNLMMDGTNVAPRGFHAANPKRTEKNFHKFIAYKSRRNTGPVSYVIIDVGLSHKFSSGRTLLSTGRWGQDATIPEFKIQGVMHDVLKVDVCQLGNVFGRIVQNYEGLSMLDPLVAAMTDHEPTNRLSAAESRSLLRQLTSTLTKKNLNRRIFYKASSATDRTLLRLGLAPSEMLKMKNYLFPEW